MSKEKIKNPKTKYNRAVSEDGVLNEEDYKIIEDFFANYTLLTDIEDYFLLFRNIVPKVIRDDTRIAKLKVQSRIEARRAIAKSLNECLTAENENVKMNAVKFLAPIVNDYFNENANIHLNDAHDVNVRVNTIVNDNKKKPIVNCSISRVV